MCEAPGGAAFQLEPMSWAQPSKSWSLQGLFIRFLFFAVLSLMGFFSQIRCK